ncbi:MAG: GerMN domain-containing protein [Firmicutes bacterium]|nr:GerMN domain-containing protein [Bacillota bacterium]
MPGNNGNDNKPAKAADEGRNASTEPKEMSINVYFVEFTADDAYLIREERVIPHTEEVAKAAIEALVQDDKTIFPVGTKVLDITLDKGLATVDFSKEVLNNTNVGSSGEALGIQSAVNTLTEFPNIEKVAFQVEGSSKGPARDWWGHIGLYDQPFDRDLSSVYKPAIWVTHPSSNQMVGIPLLIKGSARVYEGTVNIRLLDNSGAVLAETYTTASQGAPGRGDFETSLKFDPPKEGKGTLEVFCISAKDGSEQDKVSVPVQWP